MIAARATSVLSRAVFAQGGSLLPARPAGALRSLVSRPAAGAYSQTTTSDSPAPGTASSNGTAAGGAKPKDDVSGPMLEPSVVNTSSVRTLAALAAFAAAAGSTAFLPARLTAFMHITAYGIWLGTNIWNTFFVGLTMFKNMPRQMFGRVQAQLFPKYFGLTTGANIILLGSLLLAPGVAGGAAATVSQKAAVTLGIALAASLGNALYIEPLATKLMFQRYEIENKEVKTEEDKAQIQTLYKQFGKWHGISSLLNLIITCAAIGHGWHLAGSLNL